MIAVVVKIDAFIETRIKRGLTLGNIADQAKLHYATVNRVEKGQTNVNPLTAKKICDALDVSFDELFEIVQKDTKGAR